MYIASQVIVGLADVLFIISLQLKNRRPLLFVQIFSTMLFSLHYMFLSAWVGMACGLVEVIRIIVFYFLDKKPNQKHYIIASCSLIALSVASTIIGWEAWFSVIPFIGVSAVTICLAQKNMILLKCAYTLQSTCYVVYMFLIASYVGAGLEVAVMLGGFVATIMQIHREKLSKKLNENIKPDAVANYAENDVLSDDTEVKIEK